MSMPTRDEPNYWESRTLATRLQRSAGHRGVELETARANAWSLIESARDPDAQLRFALSWDPTSGISLKDFLEADLEDATLSEAERTERAARPERWWAPS
jgi:hypothetical protein